MTDETLRELATQLPYDRPAPERSEGVRASLLAAAAVPERPSPRRWLLVGGGFTAGVLAAAAVAIVIVRPRPEPSSAAPVLHEAYAQIESSSAAELEHTLVPTPSGGTDELVRVHAGRLRLAVPATRAGDRVRVTTGDAEIEGSGAYEVVVTADALTRVTVTAGAATVRLVGKQDTVFLAAGQTWHAYVETADLTPAIRPPVGPTTSAGSPIETELPPDPTATRATTSTTRAVPVTASTAGSRSASPSPSASPARTGSASPSPSASPVRTGAPIAPPRVAAPPPVARVPGAVTERGTPLETELAPPRAAVTAPMEDLSAGTPPRPAPPAPASEIERHFRAGWALLRANKLADAITELGAAADAGDSALAADARYYQAIALVKARRGAEAERALVQFLDHAPSSTRRGRAAMMLGRLIADRGDATGARTWLELAARDADPTVAAAAKAALAPH